MYSCKGNTVIYYTIFHIKIIKSNFNFFPSSIIILIIYKQLTVFFSILDMKIIDIIIILK